MDESLPIDIQIKKLLDWLISRRIVKREWHDNIVPVREKIGGAIKDMPEHPTIKDLLSGTHINYFHCKEIVEILKETEKDTKNFFGSYGSQRMKDWQDVVKHYERDNIYIAEAAQLLSQSVLYEIPGLKKQLAKCTQLQEECEKKEKDNAKKVVDFQQDFEKSCHQLGIPGKSLKKEVVALMADLPQIYEKIAGDAKQLDDAVKFYDQFLKKILDEGINEEVLPTLKFLIAKGNVTTYEWIHGEAPLRIEEPEADYGDDEEVAADTNDEIDFSTLDLDAGGDDVQLDLDGDIDWGNIGGGDEEAVDVDIDWGATEDLGEIVVEEGGIEGGVARDTDAMTMLDNRRTRVLVLDELGELEGFLRQRLAELESGAGGLLDSSISVNDNTDEIAGMIERVGRMAEELTTGKMHHLQLIRGSPKYVDRLVDALKQKLALVEKVRVGSRVVEERKGNAIREQAEVQSKLELMTKKTKELQKNIESDISKRYKNRTVHIMGGIQ